ncbi:universal stress protein [Ningiella sp. W23]|uniref:universal stress protein n=1 Tax=Ningiella sp. W23 TaxID=3023715 RepID=UPI0037570641
MKAFKKIFVIIEQNDTEHQALYRALQLKHPANTEILLFMNVYDANIESTFMLDLDHIDLVKRSLIDYHTQKLEELACYSATDNVHFTTQVIWQDTGYISAVRAIDDYKPDLVIKSSRLASAFEQWVHGVNEAQILKSCPCPILFARESAQNHTQSKGRAVLAAVDPGQKLNEQSHLDNNVLNSALALSTALDAPLHACHCFDPSYWEMFIQGIRQTNLLTDVFPEFTKTVANQDIIHALKEQHYEKFTQGCEEIVPHLEHRHFVNGKAIEALPKLASELGASTIVIGTTYRTGFLGSTAENIFKRLEIDLLVVKPDGFHSPILVNA